MCVCVSTFVVTDGHRMNIMTCEGVTPSNVLFIYDLLTKLSVMSNALKRVWKKTVVV
jgi:hypothetical protein